MFKRTIFKRALDKLDDATFLRKSHAWTTIFWLCNIPPCTLVFFKWPAIWDKYGVFYLIIVSLLTAASGEGSAWQSTRAEVKIDEQNNTINLK